jgi:hypothetical protein
VTDDPPVRRFIETTTGAVYFIGDDIVYDVNGEPRGYVSQEDVFLCTDTPTTATATA